MGVRARNIRVEVGPIPAQKQAGVIYFSTFEEMNGVLNSNRIALLTIIKESQPESIYQLAQLSGRDQGNVTKDINLLHQYGFVEIVKSKEGNRVKSEPKLESEGIEMVIKLGAGMFGIAKEGFEQLSEEFKGKKLEQNTAEMKKQYASVLKPLKNTVKSVAKKFDIVTKDDTE